MRSHRQKTSKNSVNHVKMPNMGRKFFKKLTFWLNDFVFFLLRKTAKRRRFHTPEICRINLTGLYLCRLYFLQEHKHKQYHLFYHNPPGHNPLQPTYYFMFLTCAFQFILGFDNFFVIFFTDQTFFESLWVKPFTKWPRIPFLWIPVWLTKTEKKYHLFDVM